jgi:deoxycytidine triphosphate deaminase
MFLGVDELLKLVHEKKLVENLCERELTNPEGCGFDLRLEEAYTITGEGYLGVEDRKTCEIVLVNPGIINPGVVNPGIEIRPGDFYLVKTMETVNVPENLVGILKPRSTLQRMGLFLRTTQIAPGYSGELTFALKNEGPATVKIDIGARIAHVLFAEVKGKTALYRGQWQGGRVSAVTTEKQV